MTPDHWLCVLPKSFELMVRGLLINEPLNEHESFEWHDFHCTHVIIKSGNNTHIKGCQGGYDKLAG